MKMPHYIKTVALALLIPFSANTPAQNTLTGSSKQKIAQLTKKAKGYNLWDSRKPINYTVTNDNISYPVMINYTIDSIQYSGKFSTRADFKEAITLYYLRRNPQAFHQNMHGRLIHEALHFIQSEKMKYLRSRPEYKGITFEQAYELEMWKETASHVAASIALLSSEDSIGLSDITRVTNQAAQRYLEGQTENSGYHNQFFTQALKNYDPDVTPQEGYETYMRCKAAIMTQYVNVNGKMKSFSVLPLLTDTCYKLARIPNQMLNKYNDNQQKIDRQSRDGAYFSEMTDFRKFDIMSRRYDGHLRQEENSPYPYSCRSDTLSTDVSDFFPKLHPASYNQAMYMIKALVDNEANGNHQKNQEILATFMRRRNYAVEPEFTRERISGGRE